MPHNIGEMFYFGEIPWHKLGNVLKQPANLREAIEAGKLDWEVSLIPIQTAEIPPTEILRRLAVVRTDRISGDPRRVLGVVHPDFHPLQNRKGLELFDNLMGGNKRVYHTGGYLGNGEVIWLMARIPDYFIKVRGNDVVEPYLLFSNSHDGTRAIDIRLTTIRVVCQNTLNIALSKRNSKHIFKQSHSGSFSNLQSMAENYFKFIEAEVHSTEEKFKLLASKDITPEVFSTYIEKLLPLPTAPSLDNPSPAIERTFETRMANIELMRFDIKSVYENGFQNSIKIEPAEPTLWGALNAVTAYVDHVQLFNYDKYAQIMFGKGDYLKQTAYNMAFEMLKA
jgi:phage/plasmid-like protein (TIGR03299 family)